NSLASFQLDSQNMEERINLITAEIEHEEKVIHSFRDKIINSSHLKELTEKLSQNLHLEDSIRTITHEISRLIGDPEAVCILYLFDAHSGHLGIGYSLKGGRRVHLQSKRGDIFDKWVMKSMQPLLVEDMKKDFRFDADKVTTSVHRNIRSLISVPMRSGNKSIGILRLDTHRTHRYVMEDLRFLQTVSDIAAVAIENALLYERIEQLAIRDGLTGLFLRRYLMQRLPKEFIREQRKNAFLSCLMIDIDFFKKYNDEHGHTAGDIVLKVVADQLLQTFNEPGMFVCRYGGEEFCVILPDCPKEEALILAGRFRENISRKVIPLRRVKSSITVSIGVATSPDDAVDKEELIQKADMALFQAKDKGRNKVVAAQSK
ncbi:MAG: sensor domain-containing diguanylate cyclase, partial [Candidatus Omnitrophica bacterium]|nr:sensor domain-containing diguanylate cyclase [Candidatus Omnitrophota bacterium]